MNREQVWQSVSDVLREILRLLRARTGQDFSQYKTAPVLRRIQRRQQVHGLADLATYARFLGQHPEEPGALLNELLISVTHFFRDPEPFASLERHIIPRIFAERGGRDHVRAWVAGCGGPWRPCAGWSGRAPR